MMRYYTYLNVKYGYVNNHGRLAHTFRQVDSNSAPVVYNDSQGVVALSKNPVHHNASKHIDVRYHFVRDCVISGKIGVEKISTTDNVVDGMTKCLSVDRFRSLVKVGLTSQDSFGQPISVLWGSASALPTWPVQSFVFGSCRLEQNRPIRQPCIYL